MPQPVAERQPTRSSLTRIAQFRPFGDGQLDVAFARREIILAAAVENGGSFSSLADCRRACKALWGLELDLDEIRSEVKHLVDHGQLRYNGGKYELVDKAGIELRDKVQKSEAVESSALAEWEVAVRAMDPELSEEQVAELREDLLTWIQHLITQHGIEAALVLYPEQAQDRADQFLRQIEEGGFGFLPKRDRRVSGIREKALYSFLRSPTAVQRTYLANLMTTAYMAAVFTIDPDAHEIVKDLTDGQRVYLDTNLIYDVLNLRGPRRFLTIKRVLEHTRGLGYKVCVTPWTIAEMKHSVKKAREELAKTTLPPRALADLAAEACGDQGFLTAYWRKYKETGVRPNDFFDLHEQIEALLKQVDIPIEHEGCVAVGRNGELLTEQVGLLGSIPGGGTKPRPVLEHDAQHRMLIERLRGDGLRGFSNAGYWFLTRDSVLIPYANAQRASKAHIPFAVSLSAWAHIVRSLSPRTGDYDQTLADLLDTPAVRPKGVVSFNTVTEVLGRVDMLSQDSTEEIATRMLLDQAVMEEAERQTGLGREKFLEDAIEEKGAELERELQETREAVDRERKTREESEQRASHHRDRLKQERQRRSEAERRAGELAREQEEQTARADGLIADAAARAEAAERERSKAQEAHEAQVAGISQQLSLQKQEIESQALLLRRVVAGAMATGAISAIAIPVAAGWVDGGWPLVGAVMVALSLAFAAVAWLFGLKRATALAAGIGVIIGIATSLYSILPGHESSSARQDRSAQK